jgi:hypothetical protein
VISRNFLLQTIDNYDLVWYTAYSSKDSLMTDEKATKRIAVTPTEYRELKKLSKYGETMNGIIKKLVTHYKKTNSRNGNGRFKKLH